MYMHVPTLTGGIHVYSQREAPQLAGYMSSTSTLMTLSQTLSPSCSSTVRRRSSFPSLTGSTTASTTPLKAVRLDSSQEFTYPTTWLAVLSTIHCTCISAKPISCFFYVNYYLQCTQYVWFMMLCVVTGEHISTEREF